MRSLRIVLALQSLIALAWSLLSLTTRPDFSSLPLGLFFVLGSGLLAVLALVQRFRTGQGSGLVGLIAAVPMAALIAVGVASRVIGLPAFRAQTAALALTAFAAGFVLVFPRRLARLLPRSIADHSFTNRLVAGLLVASIIAWIVLLVGYFTLNESPFQLDRGDGWILFVLIGHGLLSSAIALPTIVYAYLNLFREGAGLPRQIFVVQLVASVLCLGILVPVLGLTGLLLSNPG